MSAKIVIERLGSQVIRVTLTADVQISGVLGTQADRGAPARADDCGPGDAPPEKVQPDPLELLTVEQVAELLQVGRDKVYYLIRTGQLRSIKIGKLRRVSRAWITEFLTASLRAPAAGSSDCDQRSRH